MRPVTRSVTRAIFSIILLLVLIMTQLPVQSVSAEPEGSRQNQEIVQIPPEINKKFFPVTIPPGGTSRLTVYIYNPNEYPLSNVPFWTSLKNSSLASKLPTIRRYPPPVAAQWWQRPAPTSFH